MGDGNAKLIIAAIVSIVALTGILLQFSWSNLEGGATGQAYYLTAKSTQTYVSSPIYKISDFTINVCQDQDGDGYQNPSYPSGCVLTKGKDCNDRNKCINPGGVDYCDNGIDEDCDGADTVTRAGGICAFVPSAWAQSRCTNY